MKQARFLKTKALSLALALGLALFAGLTVPGLFQSASAAQNSYGFSPQHYRGGYTYGNGVYFAPYVFTVYSKPDERAEPIAEFHWNRKTAQNAIDVTLPNGDHRSVYADHLFFCFYPQLDVAMLPVMSDSDNGWVEVMYDQTNHKTGWVHAKAPETTTTENQTTAAQADKLPSFDKGEPAHFGVYQTWLEFMKLNAKADGIYWLSGVKEYNRSMRSADADDAKLIPVTIIRDLKVKHVRGNWLLVEVLDFERNTPIGWIRWRDDDGNLMVFPNISGQHLPIVITAY